MLEVMFTVYDGKKKIERRHFSYELETPEADIEAEVAQYAFNMENEAVQHEAEKDSLLAVANAEVIIENLKGKTIQSEEKGNKKK